MSLLRGDEALPEAVPTFENRKSIHTPLPRKAGSSNFVKQILEPSKFDDYADPTATVLSDTSERDFIEHGLPGYKILFRIHEGGQGVVYRAIQIATQRSVAIKVLLQGPLAGRRRLARFEHEAKILSKLNHSHIVTTHDFGIFSGRPYLVMEFIDGLSIDDYVTLHRLNITHLIGLAVKVCRAVNHAHQHGVLHRDLKPSNILVDRNGEPHICDFGLAKNFAGDDPASESLTQDAVVVGTFHYFSPEAAAGRADEVDIRSDVYALGIIIHQLFCGELPYRNWTGQQELCRAIAGQPPISLRTNLQSLGVKFPPNVVDLETILLKTLAKEKERRYQTAAALADDLERYLQGEAIEARADSSWYKTRKFIRRHRLTMAVVMAFFSISAASAVIAGQGWKRADEERKRQTQFADFTHKALQRSIVLFEEDTKQLAGGVRANRRFFEGMQGQLSALCRLTGNDPAMESIRGDLSVRLGVVFLATGHSAESRSCANEALRIAQSQYHEHLSPKTALSLVRAHQLLAALGDDEIAHFRDALSITGKITSNWPPSDVAACALEEAKLRTEFAKALWRKGRYLECAQQSRAAVAVTDRFLGKAENADEFRVLKAEALHWLGNADMQFGHIDIAIDSMLESTRLRTALCDAWPANAERRFALFRSFLRLGSFYRSVHRFSESREAFDKSIQIGEYLVGADPDNTEWLESLSDALSAKRHLHSDLKESTQAMEAAQKGMAASQRLVQLDPANARWQRKLAAQHIVLADAFLLTKRPDEAVSECVSAIQILECAKGKMDDLAWQVDIASARVYLGNSLSKCHQFEAAADQYAIAVDHYASLTKQANSVQRWAAERVRALSKLAGVLIMRTDSGSMDMAAQLLSTAELSLADVLVRSAGQVSAKYASLLMALGDNCQAQRARSAILAGPAPH